NLIDNAIKYTPEGGTIRLDAESDAAVCRIRVADSGLGIPAADLPHIFERFYRVDKARSRQTGKNGTGGAGLGLAIVAVLVERNSGRVWAESEIGQGTTITLEFPRDDA
nr:ATP-binding protein [Caldilineaceae bacterium]